MSRFTRWMNELDLDAEDLATCEGYVTIDAVRKLDAARTARDAASTGLYDAIVGLLAPFRARAEGQKATGQKATAFDAIRSVLDGAPAPMSAVSSPPAPVPVASSPTTPRKATPSSQPVQGDRIDKAA
jgi:hypothetical protein